MDSSHVRTDTRFFRDPDVMRRHTLFAWLRGLTTLVLAATVATAASAQTPARFLGKEDIRLYGLGLKVEPAEQTVPTRHRDHRLDVPAGADDPRRPAAVRARRGSACDAARARALPIPSNCAPRPTRR